MIPRAIFVTLFALLLLLLEGHSLTVAQIQEPRLTQLKVVDSVEDFEVPGLDRVTGWGQRSAVVGNDAPAGLFQTVARFENKPSALALFYLFDAGFRYLKVEHHRVRVDKLKRFDVGGKAFCYSVEATSEFYDPVSGRGGYGPFWELRYLDLDGDGHFERMELGDYSVPRVPAWVGKVSDP